MKKLLLLLVFALLLVQVGSIASAPTSFTITGTGDTVAISSTSTQARWIQFFAPSGNSGVAHIAGRTASSSVGQNLAAGAGFMAPPMTNAAYSLNEWYAYVANGDTLVVTWVGP